MSIDNTGLVLLQVAAMCIDRLQRISTKGDDITMFVLNTQADVLILSLVVCIRHMSSLLEASVGFAGDTGL